jgi:hypothetical protein
VILAEGATGTSMSITAVPNGAAVGSLGKLVPHFGWSVEGAAHHATGWAPGYFQSFVWQNAPKSAFGFWNTISGIPIRNPEAAAGFAGYTRNCLTGVCRAVWNGWFGK